MEMYEVLKLALDLKYHQDKSKLINEDYKFFEGRSFKCGDYIKIYVNNRETSDNLLFCGECCKCCLAATDYAIDIFNKTKRVISEKEMCDYFGERLVNSRKDCFFLPITVLKSIQGEK